MCFTCSHIILVRALAGSVEVGVGFGGVGCCGGVGSVLLCVATLPNSPVPQFLRSRSGLVGCGGAGSGGVGSVLRHSANSRNSPVPQFPTVRLAIDCV
jgi:hypothetical protein